MSLDLTIEVGDGKTIIISDNVALCYGHGDSKEEALSDYLISLGEWVRLSHRGETDNELDWLLLERAYEWIVGVPKGEGSDE